MAGSRKAVATTATRVHRRRKVMAVASAGTAVGLAAALTLASWSDSEWVFGGADAAGDGGGVGTSTFEVQQSAWTTTAPTTTGSFVDAESNPGEGLVFDILGAIVGNAVSGVLFAPTSVASTAGATLRAATTPVVTMLGRLTRGLFGPSGVASLTANVQNDPSGGRPSYRAWESGVQQVPDGQYDVAALALNVLGALGPDLDLDVQLGRGSVGTTCKIGGRADKRGVCAGF